MDIRRDIYQAIADPTRRAILLLLATQSMTAGIDAAYRGRHDAKRHSGAFWQQQAGGIKTYTDTGRMRRC